MEKVKSYVKILCSTLLIAVLFIVNTFTVPAEGSRENNKFNVVVVLDASGSMKSTDPQQLRFDAISQFTYLLADKSNNLGAVVFSTNVSNKQDLMAINGAADKDAVLGMLRGVPATGDTNIGEALTTAVDMLEAKKDSDLPSVILFLSDGNTDLKPEEAMQTSLDQKADAIQRARDLSIPIYSVCLNANEKADVSEMDQISKATGGVFMEVKKPEDLQSVFNTLYNLIYTTSTISLADESFSDAGFVEIDFDVPKFGVEEVNIILNGNTADVKVYKPDGSEATYQELNTASFKMLKLTDIVPGKWKLRAEGNSGDHIKIDMVYNQNLGIDVSIEGGDKELKTGTDVKLLANLKTGDVKASSADDYAGYTAELNIYDAYGEKVISLPMNLKDDHFEALHNFEEGSYFYDVTIKGDYVEKTSIKQGPVLIGEEEIKNTAPTAVSELVEDEVYLIPFKKNSWSLDLNTLAKDAEDESLKYKIISSSFIEVQDYKVDDKGNLEVHNFSLSKGEFIVRAVDSGGLSCDIKVSLKSHNVGVMAMIGFGALSLLGLIIFGGATYMALNRPVNGTITVKSRVAGVSKDGKMEQKSKRGKIKLNFFRVDNIGLDYNKSYILGKGGQFIVLKTDKPVYTGDPNPTKEVKIVAGAEKNIYAKAGGSDYISIKFERAQGGARRAPQRPAGAGMGRQAPGGRPMGTRPSGPSSLPPRK